MSPEGPPGCPGCNEEAIARLLDVNGLIAVEVAPDATEGILCDRCNRRWAITTQEEMARG
jgi:hypothetical protein